MDHGAGPAVHPVQLLQQGVIAGGAPHVDGERALAGAGEGLAGTDGEHLPAALTEPLSHFVAQAAIVEEDQTGPGVRLVRRRYCRRRLSPSRTVEPGAEVAPPLAGRAAVLARLH